MFEVTCISRRMTTTAANVGSLLPTSSNFKMAEKDVLEVEVDDRADFTEDAGEGTSYDRKNDESFLKHYR